MMIRKPPWCFLMVFLSSSLDGFWWSNRIAPCHRVVIFFLELTMAWHREACPLWRAVRARFADHEAGLCGKPWVTRRSVLNGGCGGLFRHGKLLSKKEFSSQGANCYFLPSQDYFHFSMGRPVKLREWSHVWSGMVLFKVPLPNRWRSWNVASRWMNPSEGKRKSRPGNGTEIFWVRVATPRVSGVENTWCTLPETNLS